MNAGIGRSARNSASWSLARLARRPPGDAGQQARVPGVVGGAGVALLPLAGGERQQQPEDEYEANEFRHEYAPGGGIRESAVWIVHRRSAGDLGAAAERRGLSELVTAPASCPARTSFSHWSSSGQTTAQVPKSAMYWYCVSRSIAFWMIVGVPAEDRAVAGQQELGVVRQDALERLR